MGDIQHLNNKLYNFWRFINDNRRVWLFYETNNTVFSLNINISNSNGENYDISNVNGSYCFQEELNHRQHFVCYGNIVLDLENNIIKSSTVVDKYNDCFEPGINDILSTFFETI